ncbi:hypothetical protein HK097_007753 [Rhizophlyctis rosea]|uniref:Uncharacterized protein n=1 Tax=Rhizophlyctis rosea TaxID=64517 RepID=A0AAD5SB70_9FUNG|nr:hypothetical protein HK097_007753 [Rhizophlyctis rosea]
MDISYITRISGKRVILASGSPRRKEILERLGLKFEVIASTFPENLDKTSFQTAAAYASENALQKAIEVYARLHDPDAFIISADTVVVLDNKILEKPSSELDARKTLHSLSNRSHTVVTAVSLAYSDRTTGKTAFETFTETTEVEFAELDDELITAYLKTGEPL